MEAERLKEVQRSTISHTLLDAAPAVAAAITPAPAGVALSWRTHDLRQQGIALRITRADRRLRGELERIGLADQSGAADQSPSVDLAFNAFEAEYKEEPT